ncbi:hypothetical protein IFM46972_01140 [Aspergillus udagawae]|uniref:Uncharacterized protein n=1 Tax=Aspergillus udagawae TaxID=91492 RepID=A0A8H3RHN8_9EURO|nr:hypothetical protein IFM46972_01140 [Aspergillus udagawae]
MRVRDAERVPEAALLAVFAVVCRVLAKLAFGQWIGRVALRMAAGTDVPACAAGGPAEQGVDHGGVADDDGDESLAAGPAAGLGGTTYRDNQDAAEDSGRHDEDSAGEEDEEFEFLAPGEPRFEEHLWILAIGVGTGRKAHVPV